ncbi:hypothetical protein [Baekduia soli]|uniref:hypothetical protein n=1 Tax=Baekduia soli TaxID=496014 RepID=UPI0016529C0F|nr:hypothetical protein [Baekduia soli]
MAYMADPIMLTAQVPSEMRDDLRRIAARRDSSLSCEVRRALRAHYASEARRLKLD